MSMQVFFYFVMPAVFIALGALATFAPVVPRAKAKGEAHVSQPAQENAGPVTSTASVSFDETAPYEENEYLKLFKASLAEEPKSMLKAVSASEAALSNFERSLAEDARRILWDPAFKEPLQALGHLNLPTHYVDKSLWIIGPRKRDVTVGLDTPHISLTDVRIEEFSTRARSAEPPAREEKSAS